MKDGSFIGNVVRDAEVRTTSGGVDVCTFTVAVNNRKSRGGESDTLFVRVSAWRKTAETCGQYVKKGMKIYVRGDLKVSAYLDKEGNPRPSLEIDNLVEYEFLTRSDDSSSNNYEHSSNAVESNSQNDYSGGFTAVETDELPF